MTKFEKALRGTKSLNEALQMQGFLTDNLSDPWIEKIRTKYISERYGLSAVEVIMLKCLCDKEKALAFAEALPGFTSDFKTIELAKKG